MSLKPKEQIIRAYTIDTLTFASFSDLRAYIEYVSDHGAKEIKVTVI